MSTSFYGLIAILAMVVGLLIPSTGPRSASAALAASDPAVSRDTAQGDDSGPDKDDSDDSSSGDSGD
jgi:hypothetical protein